VTARAIVEIGRAGRRERSALAKASAIMVNIDHSYCP